MNPRIDKVTINKGTSNAAEVVPAAQTTANAKVDATVAPRLNLNNLMIPTPRRLSSPLIQAPAVKAAAVHANKPAKIDADCPISSMTTIGDPAIYAKITA
jgi:hypothetical protein